MDYTELLPPLPFTNYVDDDGLWCERTGPFSADETRALMLAAIAAAAPAIRKAERERCLAEIEEGIWFDKTTEEILDSIADAIRALPEEP